MKYIKIILIRIALHVCLSAQERQRIRQSLTLSIKYWSVAKDTGFETEEAKALRKEIETLKANLFK